MKLCGIGLGLIAKYDHVRLLSNSIERRWRKCRVRGGPLPR